MITSLHVSKKLRLLGYSKPVYFYWTLKKCINARPRYKIEKFCVKHNWNDSDYCFSAPDVHDVWHWLSGLGYSYKIYSETEYILLRNNVQFYRGRRGYGDNEMLSKLLDLIIKEKWITEKF
jgi:hypothetical protein